MKVVYYYRGRTGSAGFLLPEDMALLKRLFAHGSRAKRSCEGNAAGCISG